jgi:hypothetical protein
MNKIRITSFMQESTNIPLTPFGLSSRTSFEGAKSMKALKSLLWLVLVCMIFLLFPFICSCSKNEHSSGPIINNAGVLTIYYTSERGANPRIVDSYAIITGLEFDDDDFTFSNSGMPCFFIPPGGPAAEFRVKLKDILSRYEWSKIDSVNKKIGHDLPLRQLCIQSSDRLCVYDIYGDPYGSLGDKERNDAIFMYMRLVNEIRLLGESYSVHVNITNREIIRKGGGLPAMMWGLKCYEPN